jgi:hypothetical protein
MAPRRRARRERPRFSVVTIVRNEASRLPRLLDSLAEFRARGGEVVVLDTGSDDDTPRVASEAGCRVWVEPRRFRGRLSAAQARQVNRRFMKAGEGPLVEAGAPLFHFAAARAHATSLAAHDFQLAVDGGDVVENLDIGFLDETARSGRHGLVQFETRTLSPIGWHLEVREYVHDRRVAMWRGRTHEYMRPRPGVGKDILPLRARRDQLFVSHHTEIDKPRGFQLAGIALDALDAGNSDRAAFYLCRSLTVLGCFRSALPLALGLDRPEIAPAVRSLALCLAARCGAGVKAGSDEVEGLLFRAAMRDPTRRDPWLRLATRCLAHGQMQAAASFAAASLSIPPRVGISEPEENFGAGPHAILYWALFWLGRRAEAQAHFETCRRLDPRNPLYVEHARLFKR